MMRRRVGYTGMILGSDLWAAAWREKRRRVSEEWKREGGRERGRKRKRKKEGEREGGTYWKLLRLFVVRWFLPV